MYGVIWHIACNHEIDEKGPIVFQSLADGGADLPGCLYSHAWHAHCLGQRCKVDVRFLEIERDGKFSFGQLEFATIPSAGGVTLARTFASVGP